MKQKQRSQGLNLGVIGLSYGNGHPYSWSAICNGYDSDLMEKCGFPVIPRYLEKNKFPDAAIPNARVTCVWTQEKFLSKKIAETCYIAKVVDSLEEMIPHVDGILLARDDAENHYEFAKPFLEEGLPIYIDKPLAFSVSEAKKIFDMQKYPGQIFTCSALKYANELNLSQLQLSSLGKICLIKGQVPKSWNRYAIHVIEPILRNISLDYTIIDQKVLFQNKSTTLKLMLDNEIKMEIHASGHNTTPIVIEIVGINKVSYKFNFCDPFNCFKKALEDFVDGIFSGSIKTSEESVLRSIKILEMGIK